MRSSSALLVLSSLTVLATAAAAQTAPAGRGADEPAREERKAGSAARYTGDAPRIDGVLDDAAWAQAQPMTEFVQRQPTPGTAATLPTEVRVLYDAGALWVAVRSHDPAPDSIQAPVGRRDMSGVSSDWVHVMIDSYNDRRTAFRFSINPAGVQMDALHSNDTNEDNGWDAVWESATTIDSAGWSAEMRIPLSQLRFATAEEERAWGFQVRRDIARRNERVDWNEVHPDRQGFVSQFGELRGIRGLRSARRLEVIPYSVARLTRAPDRPDDPFYQSNQAIGSLGADVKYGLTSNLTLTATINPDFGQVEADPSQVNLSAFESFFAERRPFFTEGSNIFRINAAFPYWVRSTGFRDDQPFYSRRLGRPPQAGNPEPDSFALRPDATTILAAAKVSGKTAGGWSLGVLNALTGEERVRYRMGADVQEATVEPLTNYFVGRAIKDFRGGNSALGGIVTATVRDLDEGDDRLALLPGSAILAGVDGRHRMGGGNYELTGTVLASHVRGDEAAISRIQQAPGHYFQRPDAGHLDFSDARTSLTGWLADAKLEKLGGGHLRGGLYLHARSPGLEMNDVGFQRSTDWFLQGAWIGYNQFKPGRTFRNWNVNANGWNGYNFGGERLTTGFNVNASANFTNNWGTWFGTDNELEAMRTDVLRGGPSFVGPAYSSFNQGVYTDGRKPVSGELSWGGWKEWATTGGGWNVGLALNLRPTSQLRLSLGPRFSTSQDPWSYVAQPRDGDGEGDPHYVFATIDQRTVSMTARVNYAFTSKLTAEFYAQPFVATGAYDRYWEVVDGHADRFEDRFRPYGGELALNEETGEFEVRAEGEEEPEYTFQRPDFNVKELRSNLVVRWEYRPGSALFVVWSQGRSEFEPNGSFRLRRDFGRLFDGGHARPTNVLLIKMNYWLNL
jgi:hypothetical protein